MVFGEGLIKRLFGGSRPENKREIEKKEIPRFSGTVESKKGDSHKEGEACEDKYIFDHQHQLYAVFDGVGVQGNGDLAAEMAGLAIQGSLSSAPFEMSEEEAREKMSAAIEYAHSRVQALNIEGQESAPLTTASVLKFFRDSKTKKLCAIIGHVGDSRIYHMNRDNFRRLTNDHNREYQDKIDKQYKTKKNGAVNTFNVMDASSAGIQDALDNWEGHDYSTPEGTNVYVQAQPGYRNKITSWLGGEKNKPDYIDTLLVKNIFPGDRFILITDGVGDNLTKTEIRNSADLVGDAYKRSNEQDNLRAKWGDDATAIEVIVDEPPEAKTLTRPSVGLAA